MLWFDEILNYNLESGSKKGRCLSNKERRKRCWRALEFVLEKVAKNKNQEIVKLKYKY